MEKILLTIETMTDDNERLIWKAVREASSYQIYSSKELDDKYELLDTTQLDYYVNKRSPKGECFYYIVKALDKDGVVIGESDRKPGETQSAEISPERQAFYDMIKKSRKRDTLYSRKDDIPLTPEEKEELDLFWGRYAFAYPEIDYLSWQTFKNRCGKFDVLHCPGSIRIKYFHKYFVNSHYLLAGQNKMWLQLQYPVIKQPRNLMRRTAGIYYDENYEVVSRIKARKMLKAFSEEQDMVMKPSFRGGGKGICFINKGSSAEEIEECIKEMGAGTYVVQECLKQSSFMNLFNDSSVNTIRATTLLENGKVYLLAALIRFGKQGSRVDNFSQGGFIVGVDKDTGVCNKWALNAEKLQVTKLPSGLDLAAQELVVPNFDKIKKTLEKVHYYMPYVKMISWDIALDENDEAVLIENNFAGGIQSHESVTGPLFGVHMKSLLDKYLIDNFYIEFEKDGWKAREYHDRVVLVECLKMENKISLPKRMYGKQVTEIFKDAFAKNKKGVILSVPKDFDVKKCQGMKHVKKVVTTGK